MALAMSTPALLADISLGFPRFATAGVQGNCDMMASNTVLASFVELRNLTVQRVDQAEPATVLCTAETDCRHWRIIAGENLLA